MTFPPKDTKNKGEWSELYAFLKVLSDPFLYAADPNLEIKNDQYYPVLKVIRESSTDNKSLTYEIKDQDIFIYNTHSYNDIKPILIPINDFKVNAEKLLKIIKNAEARTFSIDALDNFQQRIGNPIAKEKSQSKRDITLVIHDIKTGCKSTAGFSIKSKLGGASTLFNANKSTNIQYEITHENNDVSKVEKIFNALKPKQIMQKMHAEAYSLSFDQMVDSQFKANLEMIDSNFPLLLAEIVRAYYLGISNNISELTEFIALENPCNATNQSFYQHKVKDFLVACALGMTSKNNWSGDFDASGGYIIIKRNGDLVCYHIYNWNDFRDYLYYKTFMDTPSTKRHGFGKVSHDKLRLNFQIRFH